MSATIAKQPIPTEVALQLCDDIRRENRSKWWSSAHWQCWGCATFTKGETSKMCAFGTPGNRGCNLVNTRYDRGAQSDNGR